MIAKGTINESSKLNQTHGTQLNFSNQKHRTGNASRRSLFILKKVFNGNKVREQRIEIKMQKTNRYYSIYQERITEVVRLSPQFLKPF